MHWLLKYYELVDIREGYKEQSIRADIELKRWSSDGDLFKRNAFETSLRRQHELIEHIKIINTSIDLYDQYVDDFKNMVSTFKDIEDKVIYFKHIEGLKLQEIADELHYSHQRIKSIHASEMKKIRQDQEQELNKKWLQERFKNTDVYVNKILFTKSIAWLYRKSVCV